MVKKVLEYISNLWYAFFIKNSKIEVGDRVAEIITKECRQNMENLANDILVKNDMLKLPVDLIAIAKNNNIEVYNIELPDGVSGAIKYNEEIKKFQILIEKRHSKNRQRFTLAHELAHFFLQREEFLTNKDLHFDTLYRRDFDTEEAQVDYLAGAILMDRNMLIKLYEINNSVKVLSRLFGVSEAAMTVRLMKLGLM